MKTSYVLLTLAVLYWTPAFEFGLAKTVGIQAGLLGAFWLLGFWFFGIDGFVYASAACLLCHFVAWALYVDLSRSDPPNR